jgi:dTDP-4-dehydrorhamnose reductase
MRVLLFGGSGMLGSALRATASSSVSIDAPTRAEVDVSDVDAVERTIRASDAQLIINAAGYTSVDAAEGLEREARRLNADLPAVLGREAAAKGVPILHFSSDYVFSGHATRPWREDDACSPASAYGRTKREGDVRLLESGADSLIVRTAWLYGDAGRSFPRTMWERALRGESSRVVQDQRGAPTSAEELATWCWRLIARGERGVVHAANAGATSWAEVAERVYARAGFSDGVTRVSSAEFAAAAPRPKFSVLDCRKLDAALAQSGAAPRREWTLALDDFLLRLSAEVRA